MVVKEKIKRILYAKEQIERDLAKIYDIEVKLQRVILSKEKIDRWLRICRVLELRIDSFCCHGWQECCWQDYYEGAWDLTEGDVRSQIKCLLNENRKNSRKLPIAYIWTNAADLVLFVTCRDKAIGDRYDYLIVGKLYK